MGKKGLDYSVSLSFQMSFKDPGRLEHLPPTQKPKFEPQSCLVPQTLLSVPLVASGTAGLEQSHFARVGRLAFWLAQLGWPLDSQGTAWEVLPLK